MSRYRYLSSTMNVRNRSGSSSSGANSMFGVLATSYDKFDVSLTDINEVKFEKMGIAEGVKHLSPGKFAVPAFPVHGVIHGPNSRLMVPLTFQQAGKPDSPVINVWCVIVTGSTFTCLSVKTIEAFVGAGNVVEEMCYPFAIQDQKTRFECQVSKVGSRFEHVNILGSYALCNLKVSLPMNWNNNSFSLTRM